MKIGNEDLVADSKLRKDLRIKSRITTLRWRNRGLPAYRISGKIFYKRNEVEEYINGLRVPVAKIEEKEAA